MSAFLITGLSTMSVFVALATLTHLQFGKAGIVNFGVVGFAGVGMYSFGVMTVTYEVPWLVALAIATLLVGLLGLIVGRIILNLDAESVLVATLAFAVVVHTLVITEKQWTRGVRGFGTIPHPFDFGRDTRFAFMLVLAVVALALLLYAWKLNSQPYGRLLFSIQDNEPLSQSLGKPTFRQKVIFFTITSAAMGLVGALFASASRFLVPQMLTAGLTFTVWIAIILGGRKHFLGGLIGVIATFGLFNIVIETYAELPDSLVQQLPGRAPRRA
ncbi:MAG: branched-chain amino acid ABC transporter permease, partial [Acidimicrobiia bacterium]